MQLKRSDRPDDVAKKQGISSWRWLNLKYIVLLLPALLFLVALPASAAFLTFVEMKKDGVGGVDGLNGVFSVTVSPDGQHVYATGAFDDAVAVFSRNSGTGTLSFVEVEKDGVGGVDGLDGARSVAISPDGKHAYVASNVDNALVTFSRDQTTGALTFVEVKKDGVDGVDGLNSSLSVTVSPDGKNVYASSIDDDAVAVFSRNSTTGALTFVEVKKQGVDGVDGLQQAFSVTVSPDNQHVYVASIALNGGLAVFSRNQTTGALTFVEVKRDGVDGVNGLNGPRAVTVSPDGQHVYAGGGFNTLVVFSRNSTTGVLTFVEVQRDGVGGVDGLFSVFSVMVSPNGQHVYTASQSDNAVAVFSRNTTTGELAFVEVHKDGIGGVDGLDTAQAVTVSPDNQHVYAGSQIDDAVVVFSASVAVSTPTHTLTPLITPSPAALQYLPYLAKNSSILTVTPGATPVTGTPTPTPTTTSTYTPTHTPTPTDTPTATPTHTPTDTPTITPTYTPTNTPTPLPPATARVRIVNNTGGILSFSLFGPTVDSGTIPNGQRVTLNVIPGAYQMIVTTTGCGGSIIETFTIADGQLRIFSYICGSSVLR